MQAIIIAAGHGSRLLPLTLTTPKCLVAVDGRAILDHQLDALAAAGFAGATIVGGYRVEQIAAHLDARGGGLPTTLAFNPFWAAANSIGSVWAARDHLTAPFALMNGDTLFDTAILRGARDAGDGVTLWWSGWTKQGSTTCLFAVKAAGWRRSASICAAIPRPTGRSG